MKNSHYNERQIRLRHDGEFIEETGSSIGPRLREKVPAALVVESDVVLRNMARAALMSRGFEVMVAANATEAAALCDSMREPPLDVLIIDHGLIRPEGTRNGRAVAEQIARLSPGLKVLITSDCPYQVVLEENGLPEGAWFLQKPFTAAQLLEMVRSMLQPRIQ